MKAAWCLGRGSCSGSAEARAAATRAQVAWMSASRGWPVWLSFRRYFMSQMSSAISGSAKAFIGVGLLSSFGFAR